MYKENLFKNLGVKIPMNLQKFAESGDGTGNGEGAEHVQEKPGNGEGDNGDSSKPSYEELLEKLAQSETRATQAAAEAERWKAANDKSSSEAANFKKKLTEKMTAEEQLDAAKKEAQEAMVKEMNDMRTELSTIRATKRYMTLEMNEEKAEETAKAEIAGDMEKVIANVASHIKEIKKAAAEEAINKFLAERPDIKAGNGDGEKGSLAEEKAKEFAPRKANVVSEDKLKKFM